MKRGKERLDKKKKIDRNLIIWFIVIAIILIALVFILKNITGRAVNATSSQASCIDTDKGLDFNTYGEVIYNKKKYKDRCLLDKWLYERYCQVAKSGKAYSSYKAFKCPKKCKNGACEIDCASKWQCDEWSNCVNRKQTRTCTDLNKCKIETNKPALTQECTPPELSCNGIEEGIGVYDFSTGIFYLKNSLSSGKPDNIFKFGWKYGNSNDMSYFYREYANPPVSLGPLVPVAGDWDGDGIDTIGLYDQDSAVFSLKNSNSKGNPDINITFDNPDINRDKLGIQYRHPTDYKKNLTRRVIFPIAGDWDGDGIDGVGLFDFRTKKIYLKNLKDSDIIILNDPNYEHNISIFGDINRMSSYFSGTNDYPNVGDINKDGKDDIIILSYAGINGNIILIEGYLSSFYGDWNNDGEDDRGMYDAGTSTFYLRYTTANADIGSPTNYYNRGVISFVFGEDISSYKFPVIGKWYNCKKTCTPNCTNKECGDDGCGGECYIDSGNKKCESRFLGPEYKCVNNDCVKINATNYKCNSDSDCGYPECGPTTISAGMYVSTYKIVPKCVNKGCVSINETCTIGCSDYSAGFAGNAVVLCNTKSISCDRKKPPYQRCPIFNFSHESFCGDRGSIYYLKLTAECNYKNECIFPSVIREKLKDCPYGCRDDECMECSNDADCNGKKCFLGKCI